MGDVVTSTPPDSSAPLGMTIQPSEWQTHRLDDRAMECSVVGVAVSVTAFVEVVVVKDAAFLALECVHRNLDTVNTY